MSGAAPISSLLYITMDACRPVSDTAAGFGTDCVVTDSRRFLYGAGAAKGTGFRGLNKRGRGGVEYGCDRIGEEGAEKGARRQQKSCGRENMMHGQTMCFSRLHKKEVHHASRLSLFWMVVRCRSCRRCRSCGRCEGREHEREEMTKRRWRPICRSLCLCYKNAFKVSRSLGSFAGRRGSEVASAKNSQ